MCGIAGIINFDKKPIDKNVMEDMVRVQRHRGPDDTGLYVDGSIGLGHARLSIIDLSKDAHQPMPNEDSTLFIVHNGEIYNYLELKKDLKARGHVFRSKSDTEVILHAYEEWAEGCLGHFNGMWAFTILDLKDNHIFASRDRFGVKPFYYYLDRDHFIFASEIKALLKHPAVQKKPNDQVIFEYLSSGYGYMDISDETFFAGIRQLRGSHYLKLSMANGRLEELRYWDLDPSNRKWFKDEEDAHRAFYELFEDSIRLRLRSDVPLGVSLSGGLDSSSITCVTAKLLQGKPLETFSSCFDEEEYDERRFIKPILDKTGARANFIFTRPENLFNEIDDIIWHQEEPYSTLSIFPQWYVMKLAREKGVKVLLTGQGGDETLGGYHKYYLYLFADLIYSLRWKEALREIGLNRDTEGVARKVSKIIGSYVTPHFLKKWINKRSPNYIACDFARAHVNRVFTKKRFGSILNNDLYHALKISPLPSLLHIDDRSSMAHSVESRSPFLDYKLVEFLFSLGPEYKIRDGLTKYILRMSMKGILPDEVRLRRDKMGFATPLEKWLKTALRDMTHELLNSKEFSDRPYFNQKAAQKKFEDFLEGRGSVTHYTIWSWINLELWLRRFIDAG